MQAVVNFAKSWWWLLLAVAALFWLLASLIGSGPPRSITIAGGSAGGAYARAAEELADAMRAIGVEPTVVPTSGSVENLARLKSTGPDRVDVALLQGGVATEADGERVSSLGAVFLEPVWVFVRGYPTGLDFQTLRGLRVAVGPQGSGGRAAAERFLADQGLTKDVTLIPLGGADAAKALMAGSVDAAVLVASPRAGWVKDLLSAPGIRPAPFLRAPAFERLYPFAAAVTLRRGVVSLSEDLPDQDVPLMAAAAQIAVRQDLHPALQGVLLEAIKHRYAVGDALSPAGAFPNPKAVDLPLSDEARRYYDTGPTFLRRVLPYWWANLLERAWIFLLPALTLAIPLVRAAPPVYRWRVRSRIYRWYRDLTALEIKGRNAASEQERTEVRASLANMLRETGEIEVPLPYSDELFRLRSHIAFVEGLVAQAQGEPARAINAA